MTAALFIPMTKITKNKEKSPEIAPGIFSIIEFVLYNVFQVNSSKLSLVAPSDKPINAPPVG